MRPLVGRDARLYDLLAQATAIARRNNLGTGADIFRVALEHLPAAAPYRRALTAAHARADAAEQRAAQATTRARELQAALDALRDVSPRRVVELSRNEYEAFALFCEGEPRQAIASELGIDPRTVSNYVSRVAEQVGGASTMQAAALVNRNVVQIQAKAAKRRRVA